jgi:hypothetical protein
MILFNFNLRVVLIPGTIVFLRKVQNPTYFWVPIVWDLDCVNRTLAYTANNNRVCAVIIKIQLRDVSGAAPPELVT